ncbi:MAG: GatB/YqeY domain-containing protein [Gammaproteobacteria bacterium SHHR-1]|uniref:GatB/YqeY domain-containing protein n=1 Tax=Magnetovirga frankeli TaxID=947516 RepID=UPI0012930124|nr:GatB/YqeY domain-containing protein [gamma proteobacterium SS-5]
MLKQRILNDVKLAMKAGDKPRLATLRLISAAIKQREVDERIELDDSQMLAVLEKMVKQRRESISQYQKAARNDLVEQEQFELGILQEYLPEPLGDAEIAELIEQAIDSTGASSIKDMGKVVGQLKTQMQGRADMAQVSGLVKQKLVG